MTNKELIDHCNDFWSIKGYCGDCPHEKICGAFIIKYKDTPCRENHLHDGKYYTDEEIEV